MTTTPIISTLGNAALALSYYFISPKIKALTHVGLKTQMQAFGVSTLVQACFQYSDEDPDKKSTLTENVIRYSLPFILIGGASFYTDKAAFKTNALVTTLLGVSQIAIGHVTSNAVDERTNSKPFDADAWEKHYGKVEDVPKPDNIEEILNSPCPFCPGKKVRDTHMLTLIPATVDGEPFTLDLLSQLIEKPKCGYKNSISRFLPKNCQNENLFLDLNTKNAYWVLMTRELVSPEILEDNREVYKKPLVLEATTAILTHYVRIGECVCGLERQNFKLHRLINYTACQDTYGSEKNTVFVGGLNSKSLQIIPDLDGFNDVWGDTTSLDKTGVLATRRV